MKKINNIFNLLPLVILTALAACHSADTEKPEEHHEVEGVVELTQEQVKIAGVELGRVERKQISGAIRVNGLLDVPPQQLVSVSAPLGGFLKSTTLLQGSRVIKGQLIAVIENPEYIQLQQDYLEAKSQFEFAEADYTRQQELARENVNAQKTLQLAKTTYQSWLGKRNGLLSKLKLINVDIANLEAGTISSTSSIYAPLNGFVTDVNVNIGKFVTPTDVLFEIVDTEHLHAELIIFEKDVLKIAIGQKVRFTLANEVKERVATVHLIGREISEDRTIRIHCHIEKEDKNLLPGMYLKAIVETGDASVTALPDNAIVDYQGAKYIFIKAEEAMESHSHTETEETNHGGEGIHYKMQEITTGDSELGYTEIVLPAGWNIENEIVVKGAYAILSKMKVGQEEGHSH